MTIILDPEKFSQLPAAGPLTGPEIIPIVQGGVNKQTTVDDLPRPTGFVETVVAGDNITVDDTDPANPIVSADSAAVDSVNGQTGAVVLDQDDIGDGTTYKQYSQADKSKLAGIEAGAEVNNISDANAADLTDGGANTLHYHASDRDRANHTGTQLAATISDFDTEVANNTDVAANTAARHTHANKPTLDAITAAFTSADETKLDGIEAGAEVNNISDANATDLTDGGDTTLHKHDGRYYTEAETDTLLAAKQNSLGYTAENVANKDTDGTLAANSDTKYASQKATKTYADTKVAASTLSASGKGSVVHGSVAGTPRPTGYLSIEWIGDVEPTNATNDDTWIDTSS